MTSLRRVISALLAIVAVFAIMASAQAVTPDDYDPSNPSVLENDHLFAESAYLMDMETGETLLTKDSRVRRFPASTTKIMTLLLAVESDIPMDQEVTIPLEAGDVPAGSSVIGIQPGDVMTWEDLLYAFMLMSGNDGGNAIAMLVDDSIPAFVQRMNLRAMQLGCEGTHFVNAHGYQDQDHYTTARDLARIANYAMQNDTFRAIAGCGRRVVTVTRGGQSYSKEVENRNSLLLDDSKYYYQGANGIKTGHTSDAGWCVVASAERDGVELMAVVLDCATEDRKWADAHKLLNYGFTQYAAYSMEELLNIMRTDICTVNIENAIETDPSNGRMILGLENLVNGDATRMVQRNSEVAMQAATETIAESMTIEWNRPLVAPVTAGEVLGKLSFVTQDGIPVTADLTASRDLEAQPEPTPTPEPTPAPPTAGDLIEEGDTPQARQHNLTLLRTMLGLLIAALVLVIIMAIIAQVRKNRRKRSRRRRGRSAASARGRSGNADARRGTTPRRRAR